MRIKWRLIGWAFVAVIVVPGVRPALGGGAALAAATALVAEDGRRECVTGSFPAYCITWCYDGASGCEPFNDYLCVPSGNCYCCEETEGRECPPNAPPPPIITLDGSGANAHGPLSAITAATGPMLQRTCAGIIVARAYDDTRAAALSSRTRAIRL